MVFLLNSAQEGYPLYMVFVLSSGQGGGYPLYMVFVLSFGQDRYPLYVVFVLSELPSLSEALTRITSDPGIN